MRRYAENTAVPISRSRGEIDKLLRSWGADGIQWTDEFKSDRVTLRFSWPHDGTRYMARLGIRLPTTEVLEPRCMDGRTRQLNQGKLDKAMAERGRQEHRILMLWVKAALNAVAAGIVTAEELFLPFLEGGDGKTVAEYAVPRLSKLITGGAASDLMGSLMPSLMPRLYSSPTASFARCPGS